jgi:ubiquinone/menaquinone biosynthesis C-methylase UbiE
MDPETIAAYERSASIRCAHYRLIMPTELRRFAHSAFHLGQPTADIGCGSGRDVAWLNEHDFPTVGYDASPAMLTQARQAYPSIVVREDHLPELASIADASYTNILCSATLMHVSAADLPRAISSLARILQANGRLLLSVRSSRTDSEREADGRLFTPISSSWLEGQLIGVGLTINAVRQDTDWYRKGITWLTMLAEKADVAALGGM